MPHMENSEAKRKIYKESKNQRRQEHFGKLPSLLPPPWELEDQIVSVQESLEMAKAQVTPILGGLKLRAPKIARLFWGKRALLGSKNIAAIFSPASENRNRNRRKIATLGALRLRSNQSRAIPLKPHPSSSTS